MFHDAAIIETMSDDLEAFHIYRPPDGLAAALGSGFVYRMYIHQLRPPARAAQSGEPRRYEIRYNIRNIVTAQALRTVEKKVCRRRKKLASQRPFIIPPVFAPHRKHKPNSSPET